MKRGSSAGNRLVALVLSIVMVLGMLPAGIVTVDAVSAYGTVEGLSNGVTVSGEGAMIRAVFAGELTYVAADPSIGRHQDGWWVGIQINAPEGVDLTNATYLRGSTENSFWQNKDSADDAASHYIRMWCLVNEEYLKQANLTDGLSTYTWKFNWDNQGEGDEKYEQTVVLDIDADQTILKDSNGAQKYPKTILGYGAVEPLTPGALVSGSQTEKVSVSYNQKTVVSWVAADPSIGRYQDGWWAGMKITAPELMTEEQVRNARYMSGSSVRSFWDHKDSADTDMVHYMTMWVPLNKLISGNMTPYVYQFDWNDDGVYEQQLTMTVDPQKVTLTRDGTQVYPVLGEVSSYNGGTVTGSGTGNVTVMIREATLNWSPENASGTRPQSWWVGILVEAPVGMETSTLEQAKLQSKNNPDTPWEEISAVKEFKSYRDTDRSIQLWRSVTPASLDEFKGNGKDITMCYRFDWDGDGIYDQNITFIVDPDGNIVLNKAAQTGFCFETEIPEDIWVGDVHYQNAAVGGQGDGAVTYEIIDEDRNGAGVASVDSQTGELTFHKIGTVTVKATKAGDSEGFYNSATAQYTITAGKKDQEAGFAISEPGMVTYQPDLIFMNAVINAFGDVTYEIIDEDGNGEDVADIDPVTGDLTINKAGVVTVKATIAGDEQYNEKSVSYKLIVDAAEQPDFCFKESVHNLTWNTDEAGPLELTGALGTGDYVWKITDGADVAEVSEDGKITLLKAGSFTIEAVHLGDACYKDSAAVSATVLVQPAAQTGFGFSDQQKLIQMTYNDNDNKLKLEAAGGQTEEAVVYTLVDGDAVTVTQDGNVTILKAGTVKVQATRPGNDRYAPASDVCTISIEKANQSFTFDHAKQIFEVYGLETFHTKIVPSEKNSGKVYYEVSDNKIGATVDQSGVVTFGNSRKKIGEVTVTVTLEEDECYNGFTDSYVITLTYEKIPEPAYTLSGDKIIPESDWYTGDVTITSPSGYKISFSDTVWGNTWSDSVTWGTEGYEAYWGEVPAVYLRNIETRKISSPIFINELKLDKSKPVVTNIDCQVKVLDTIGEKLFGLSPSELTVTVSAEDEISGIASVAYSLDDGNSYREILNGKDGEFTFTIPAQNRSRLMIKATDVAGNEQEITYQNKEGIDIYLVVDDTPPGLAVAYEGIIPGNIEGVAYAKGEKVTVNMKVSDENYDLRKSDPVVTVNGEEVAGWAEDEEKCSADLTFDLIEEGDYLIQVSFQDRLDRTVEYSKELRIDRTGPKIESDIEEGAYYTDAQTFELKVTEHNFDAGKMTLEVAAKNSKNESVLTDAQMNGFMQFASNPENWMHDENSDAYTLKLELTKDANYTITLNGTDVLGNPAQEYKTSFTIDAKDPEAPVLTLEVGTERKELVLETISDYLFGFSKETVVVTVHAGDDTSGIDYLEYKLQSGDEYTRVEMDSNGNYTFELNPQYRGRITAIVYDKAGHSAMTEYEREVVVDDIAPAVEIEFEGTRVNAVKADKDGNMDCANVTEFDDETRFVYSSAVTATIRVTESNFFKEVDNMNLQITKDGVVCGDWASAGITDSGWKTEKDVYERQITMTRDGDYQISAEYMDHSMNEMQWESKEYGNKGVLRYESNIHTVDTTKPEMTVIYSPAAEESDDQIFDGNRTATIRITERNFCPSNFDLKFDTTFMKTDESFTTKDLTQWQYWAPVEGEADTWETSVTFDKDAVYEIAIFFKDIANNSLENPFKDRFVVDKTAPDALKVTYRVKDQSVVDTLIGSIIFGNQADQHEAVLSMTDVTAGVEYIKLEITPEGPECATSLVMPEELEINADGSVRNGTKGFIGEIRSKKATNGELTLAFDIPPQFRAEISFRAYDAAGNYSDCGNGSIFVVDTIAPECTVSYKPSNVVDTRDMKTLSGFDKNQAFVDDQSQETSCVMYFNRDAVATIQIGEANFDPAQVEVQVLDANKNLVSGWKRSDWTTATEAGKTDIHTQTVTISTEGDYWIRVKYQDHSGNTPVEYLSNRIVIDKKAPIINVVYSNEDVKTTQNGRDYFDKPQTATITIMDHNFRADDVVVKVTGKNAADYAEQGTNREKWSSYDEGTWRRVDDTYQLTLDYTDDANYSFDVEYCDLAGNPAADYAVDLFTVDQTPPRNLKIEYSTSVKETILENITFGFYNAKVTVTISAEDDPAGIHQFMYSYKKSPGVSAVNAELLNAALAGGNINYVGSKATATFEIPREVLTRNNQFNGMVNFSATDRSGNSASLWDGKRIVVDNISPTSTINFNEPVKEANGGAYYAGNIEGTIEINEANFYSQDVHVTVTKDGAVYPVNVAWQDESVDFHTGRFVLTEDGDYTVSVSYTDRSNNAMVNYTSNRLTLDTEAPVIRVSDIKANTANKDKKYGFAIEFSDTNLDAATMKPSLVAVIKNADNKYEISAIDLGEAKVVSEGKIYTYEVENLTEDAMYTLSGTVADLSGNTTSQVLLEDGKLYDEVAFSVNRNGSVFVYGDDFTANLANRYYVYSVDQDIVVTEINVDPVETYLVTLNGRELTEGTEYTTDQSSNPGEWSKRNYRIKRDLFTAEGEYSIIVASVDKANNAAYSDIKSLNMSFVVDRTAPVVTISGLETGGRYQAAEQTVTLIPTDEGGRLSRLRVIVMDSDGRPLQDDGGNDISVRFDMSGKELLEYLDGNEGKVIVTIPEGLNNQVRIIANDCAVNSEGDTNTYNELFTRVTVSKSQWIIFVANRPLFFGTITTIVLLIVGIFWILFGKKKRSENKKD